MEEASGIGVGRYSQVKHQEHEARRLVGIDESDWGKKRQKGRDRDGREWAHIKGLFHLQVSVDCYWEGRRTDRGGRDPKAGHTKVEQSQGEGNRSVKAMLGTMGYGENQQEVAVG